MFNQNYKNEAFTLFMLCVIRGLQLSYCEVSGENREFGELHKNYWRQASMFFCSFEELSPATHP